MVLPFPVPKGMPRIWLSSRGQFFDFPAQLTIDPETVDPRMDAIRTQSGAVEVMPGVPVSVLILRFEAMDAATRVMWKRLFDYLLVKGEQIRILADASRYFWLAGDDIEGMDLEGGQGPNIGRFTVETAGVWGVTEPLAWTVVSAVQQGATKVSLLENGDLLDGSTPWTVTTGTTLQMSVSTYFLMEGQSSRCLEFMSLANGTKTVKATFGLDGDTAATLPNDYLTLSFQWRAVYAFGTNTTNLVTMKIGVPSNHAHDVTVTMPSQPGVYWQKVVILVDMSALADTDTSLEWIITFSDSLSIAPVYFQSLQVEPNMWASGFLPNSTARALDGARATADILKYANRLGLYQNMALANAARFGFTVAMTIQPLWDSAVGLPSATVCLYTDADAANSFSPAALKITLDSTTLTAVLRLANNTTKTLTVGLVLSPLETTRIIFSARDATVGNTDGSCRLQAGVSEDTDTFAGCTARQGRFFWAGTDATGAAVADIRLADFCVEPFFAQDGQEFDANDIAQGMRPDRSSWTCVLDPAQKGRSDHEERNEIPLECRFWEVV